MAAVLGVIQGHREWHFLATCFLVGEAQGLRAHRHLSPSVSPVTLSCAAVNLVMCSLFLIQRVLLAMREYGDIKDIQVSVTEQN